MSNSYAHDGPYFIGHSDNENVGSRPTGNSLSCQEVGLVTSLCIVILAILACCIKFRHFFMAVLDRLVPVRISGARPNRHTAGTAPNDVETTPSDASSDTLTVVSQTDIPTDPEVISELGIVSLGSHDDNLPVFTSPASTHIYKDFVTSLATYFGERANIVFHRGRDSSF
jgi:hypothetical protein